MIDNLFANITDYSSLIKDINIAIHKHTINHPNIRCLITIHNHSESMTFSNVKNQDVFELLQDLSKSYDPATSTAATTEYI